MNLSGVEEKWRRIEGKTIKTLRNLFKLNTENESSKDRKISHIRKVFKQDYYKPKRVADFFVQWKIFW